MPQLTRRDTFQKLLSSKTITFFPAVCLLVNAMTGIHNDLVFFSPYTYTSTYFIGPAIPFTPQNFQNAGWFLTVLFFIFFAVVSSYCCLFMVEAMQAIPGNRHFQGNVEFATYGIYTFSCVDGRPNRLSLFLG